MEGFAYGPTTPVKNKKQRRRSRRVALAVVSFVLAIATGAVAAWLITVDNAPSATKVGTLAAPVVSAAAPFPGAGKQCFPGNTCDAAVDITNPNAGTLLITSVDVPTTPGITTGCNSNLTVNAHTLATPISIPPGTTTSVIIKDALNFAAAAPSSCQGQALTGINLLLTFSTP